MKKLLAIVMTFAIAFGICSLAFASEDGFITTVDSVTDVPEGWTAIRTAEDLNNIRNDLAGKYILMNDIDLSVYDNWSPIGDATTPFTGTLDGNGYTIKNMRITSFFSEDTYVYIGFLGYTKNASIYDLKLTNIDINITNENEAFYNVGGIVGDARYSSINNCYSNGEINVIFNGTCYGGGIVGDYSGTEELKDCINETDIYIKAKDEICVGGVVGGSSMLVNNCANRGNVRISNYSEDKTTDYFVNIGGVCGNMYLADILNCYNAGSIEIIDSFSSLNVGGVCGKSFSITNAYNIGDITCLDKASNNGIGGVAGRVIYEFLGMGVTEDRESYISNCYYLDATEVALGNEDKTKTINVKALTREEFNLQESFVGFDFENIWVMNEELGYPCFISTNKEENEPNLIQAKIKYLPIKNIVVFDKEKMNIDEIILNLYYSDGEKISKKVVWNGENYYAGNEVIKKGNDVENIKYGLNSFSMLVGEENISVEYTYLFLPTIFDIIDIFASAL